MAPVDLPYLQIYRSDGLVFAYYRRAGQHICLKGEIGSPEFLANYEAARVTVERHLPAANRPAPALPGSLRALVLLYRAAPEFRELGDDTRASYDRHIEALLPRFGDLPIKQLPRSWVLGIRDELQDTPRKANLRVAVIRRLLSFAIDREWRIDNPAARVKPLRTGPGYRAWTQAEADAMTSPAAGDVALPILIGLHTAQRQADILRLVWTAYDGSTLRLRQGKAAHLKGAREVVIPVHPELAAELDRLSTTRTAAVICTTSGGKPWKRDWFKHRFAEVRTALDMLADLQFHGLRHSAASRLAEAGASDAEIQSITGHRTRAMVAHYTAGARQEKLARAAVVRLPGKDER